MPRTRHHVCLDIKGGIANAKQLCNCITVNGRQLRTVSEVRTYLQSQLDRGRKYLPYGDCDNFDYQTGCLGHTIPDVDQQTTAE